MANSDAIVSVKSLTFGCHILEPGNAAGFRTGDWSSQTPVLDKEKCIKCGMCWIFCPEMAYNQQDEEGYFIVDLNYCKGCGICAHECPKDAITMVEKEG